MKVKTIVLLLAALITLPLATIAGVLYGGSKVPIGTFRTMEKEKTPAPAAAQAPAPADAGVPASLLAGEPTGATNGTIPSLVNDDVYSGRSTLTRQKNITEINSNGSVRINNHL